MYLLWSHLVFKLLTVAPLILHLQQSLLQFPLCTTHQLGRLLFFPETHSGVLSTRYSMLLQNVHTRLNEGVVPGLLLQLFLQLQDFGLQDSDRGLVFGFDGTFKLLQFDLQVFILSVQLLSSSLTPLSRAALAH